MLDLGIRKKICGWEKAVHRALSCHLNNINLPDPVPSHLPFGPVGTHLGQFPLLCLRPLVAMLAGRRGQLPCCPMKTQEKPYLLPPETYLAHPSRILRRGPLAPPGRAEAIAAAALGKQLVLCSVLSRQ